jgi:hypothetical protein
LHRATYGAVHFGRTGDNRFDDPQTAFGVLYIGEDVYCAFIETFGDFRGVIGQVTLAVEDLTSGNISQITAARAVRLVDLRGPTLARLGADARLWTADYWVSQQWSRALHDHPSKPDGSLYPARHDPDRVSLALFEDRVAGTIADRPQGNLYPDNWRLIGSIIAHYGVSLHA